MEIVWAHSGLHLAGTTFAYPAYAVKKHLSPAVLAVVCSRHTPAQYHTQSQYTISVPIHSLSTTHHLPIRYAGTANAQIRCTSPAHTQIRHASTTHDAVPVPDMA
eukprot:3940621-Rhodomonas_salina.3